jgi:hypothetical protein
LKSCQLILRLTWRLKSFQSSHLRLQSNPRTSQDPREPRPSSEEQWVASLLSFSSPSCSYSGGEIKSNDEDESKIATTMEKLEPKQCERSMAGVIAIVTIARIGKVGKKVIKSKLIDIIAKERSLGLEMPRHLSLLHHGNLNKDLDTSRSSPRHGLQLRPSVPICLDNHPEFLLHLIQLLPSLPQIQIELTLIPPVNLILQPNITTRLTHLVHLVPHLRVTVQIATRRQISTRRSSPVPNLRIEPLRRLFPRYKKSAMSSERTGREQTRGINYRISRPPIHLTTTVVHPLGCQVMKKTTGGERGENEEVASCRIRAGEEVILIIRKVSERRGERFQFLKFNLFIPYSQFSQS